MTIISIMSAFGGGIFGALVGGTISFIFTGIVALLGFGISISAGNSSILNEIVFGPFFGPQVSFVGAVAAAAYTGRKNKMSGADVNMPLFVMKDSVSLLIGGIFGMCGFVLNYYLSQTGLGLDSIATTVILLGLVTRFFIANDNLTGNFEPNENRFKNFNQTLIFDSVWAFGFSLVVGFAVITTGLPNFGWAISAISLVFLFTKVEDFPVSHHITMVAGYAASTFENIYIAALFGVIAALLGDFLTRTTNTKVRSHLDMPAFVIAILGGIILTVFN